MQNKYRFMGISIAAILLGASASVWAADDSAASSADTGVWQHHQETVDYYGRTSQYTCDGLGSKVKKLLVFFGARRDLKVRAGGCVDGPNQPSSTAWVKVDFYSLMAAEAGAADTASGKWVAINIMPKRPQFMDREECDLIEQFEGLLTKDFSVRNMVYHANCIPGQVLLGDYSVKGEVFKPEKK